MVAAVETMAYGRGIPWHRLGKKTPNPLSTAVEMLEYAGLDWEVGKVSIQTVDGMVIPDRFATVRESDGAPLGIVGRPYQIVQNKEAFDWADALVDDGGMKYETAGSLFGGRRVFLSMELPEGIQVPGDAGTTNIYLLITNSHDGSSPLISAVTPVRSVCSNTVALALRSAVRTFRIRHTGSIEGKLQQAREALGITFTYRDEFSRIAGRLALAKVTNRQVEDILRAAFPVPESQDTPERIDQSDFAKVQELYRTTENLDPIRGTAWGLLQAVGEYVDHEVPYRGRIFGADDVRMDSLVYGGPGAARKQKAFDLIMAKVPSLAK